MKTIQPIENRAAFRSSPAKSQARRPEFFTELAMRKEIMNPDMVSEILFLSMLVVIVFALVFTSFGALHW